MKFIKKFQDVAMNDLPLVGGKNASLGEMIQQLTPRGIKIPLGFAITVEGYWHYIKANNFLERMKTIMARLKDPADIKTLRSIGAEIRSMLESGKLPDDLIKELDTAYHELSQHYGQQNCDVAVRSSATAEDLPEASFAGQQDTFLNISGIKNLHNAVKKSIASLFTDRAIVYRIEHGFDHFNVGLSVGVQKMIRSDLASAGVIFSIDTETGFNDVVMINSSWGLGEVVVKGQVNPDEFRVHKPTLMDGYTPIIKKFCGDKKIKIVYGKNGDTISVPVPEEQQQQFSLTDQEILELARQTVLIEQHYSKIKNTLMPMDIEWAKDGVDNQLYILQARPETVHAPQQKKAPVLKLFLLADVSPKEFEQRRLLSGQSIGQQIAAGKARVIQSINDAKEFNQGDILITGMTDPDWVPLMKKAGAIVTDQGGRTCHAAIVSRELGISALVGTHTATKTIKTGQDVTVDCSKGLVGSVYDGILKFKIEEIALESIPQPPVELCLNIADPDRAYSLSFLPSSGVGLARTEFIIANTMQIHPMAAMHPEKILDKKILEQIQHLARPYKNLQEYCINTLAQGAGTIAAAFYPRPVIVRLSDFKTNEYRNLLGGQYFEPKEANPMLGLRGASRYYNDLYKEAFALECKAMLKVRRDMGLKNVKIMIPFVRTVHEAKNVIELMAQHDLKRGDDELELIMMVEIPSNVLLIDQFSTLFDGFSIGSNDLTQTTLAVDRDSELLAPLFDERDEAVKKMMAMAIKGAHEHHKPIGICGQAPSDFPEIGTFLIKEGIDYLSLNADALMPFLMREEQHRKK